MKGYLCYLIVYLTYQRVLEKRKQIYLNKRKMKKILSLAAVASMAVAANASEFDNTNYIEKWGQLKLVGNQLSSASGEAIQLKGWSTFSLHFGDVNGCLGKSQWELMKHYGANIVRLAMYIDDTNDGGSYLANKETTKQKVKGYIDDAYAAGIYVLVDWHTLETNGKEGNPWNQKDEAKNFFSEISSYAKSKGYNHVLYELCNEPKCDGWATIKKYAEYVIPAITANQPDAMIIVGTNNWCQDILEPVSNPIGGDYKKNVLYSFHYDACSHYSLLGNFRSAQGSIPVFVSEWSAVKFDGNGPFCKQNAEDFIYACGNSNTKQLVSWCIWNWGKKNEASSFFTGTCTEQNLSQYKADDGKTLFGEYVSGLMSGGKKIEPRPLPTEGPFDEPNKIPTDDVNAFHWDAYNYGGEGLAYHDGNGGAWEKTEDGVVTDYKVGKNEEVDVFSLAVEMQWLDKKFPYSVVKDGKVESWDDVINTDWKDANNDNKPTYRSLNGGRMYSGTAGSRRPDEGVDISGASCLGTTYKNAGYQNLGWVEKGEWIKFTVDVEKPGYYKIGGIIGAEYDAPTDEGEISITSVHGNHLRVPDDKANPDVVSTFGFAKTTSCADPTATTSEPWNCWSVQDAMSDRYEEILCAFPNAGANEIIFTFVGNAGGVGPLTFDFVGDLEPGDPITSVSNASAEDVFSIYPNPTSGEFTVVLAENAEANVEVINVAGQVVFSQDVEGSATINKALAAGVYTVVVKSNGAVSTQKLIVK